MHIQVINFNLEGILVPNMKQSATSLPGLLLRCPGSFQNTGLPMSRTIPMVAFTSGKHEMPIKPL